MFLVLQRRGPASGCSASPVQSVAFKFVLQTRSHFPWATEEDSTLMEQLAAAWGWKHPLQSIEEVFLTKKKRIAPFLAFPHAEQLSAKRITGQTAQRLPPTVCTATAGGQHALRNWVLTVLQLHLPLWQYSTGFQLAIVPRQGRDEAAVVGGTNRPLLLTLWKIWPR